MINKIINWSINNRFIFLFLLSIFVVIGIIYGFKTSVDAIPDLSDVQVIIQANYPGQSPSVVEDVVTYPLTTTMLSVPGAEVVRGVSFFGVSYVYIIFKDGTDLYWARSRVLEYLSQVGNKIPKDVTITLGPDATGVGWIYEYALVDKTNNLDIAKLTTLQNWFLKFELQKVLGVSEVATIGGMNKQYQVIVNPDKLRAYKINLTQVQSALQNGNADGGGSVISAGEAEFVVRSNGFIRNINDVENIPITISSNGTPVLIKDIAFVRLGPEARRGLAELNGMGESVGGIIVMRFGKNAMETINNIKNKLNDLKSSLPKGVDIITTYDRSKLIKRAIDSLKDKLLEEIVLVSIICMIFLFHFRSSLVIILTLPISIIFALDIMRLQGVNANIMSLGGIAIAIGAMIDAAVVMVENIHKHIEHTSITNENRWKVIYDACSEISKPLFLSLLIITISFVPIFALEGQEGKLFDPLVFTKTYSMAISALLSITLVPILCGLLIRGKIISEHDNPINKFLYLIYTPIINNCLKFPKTIIFFTLLCVLSIFYPLGKLGTEFMPTLNEGDILYMPSAFPSISIEATRNILQKTDKLIMTVPEVETVFGKSGRAQTATDPAPLSMFETIIQLKDPKLWRKNMTVDKIIEELDSRVKLPGLSNSWVMPIKTRIDMLSTGIKTPIGIKVFGPNFKVIQKVGKDIESVLSKLPETSTVYAERANSGKYVNIDIDRQKAARYGLNISDINLVVQNAIGGKNIGESIEGRERYPIQLRYPRNTRYSINQLQWLPIVTNLGSTISLGQVSKISIVSGPDTIRSENAILNSYVYITPSTSDLEGYVTKATKEIKNKVKFPQGYSYIWSGQFEYIQRAKHTLFFVIPITIIIISFFLFLCFNNFIDVFFVLITIPFALTGGVWLLYLLNYNLSVAAGVGFIALFGIATETVVIMIIYLKNSLDYKIKTISAINKKLTNQDIVDAVIDGCLLRLRPKVMTVCAIIGGLIPIMIFDGTGSEIIRRIAAPMIGGMITSTILTLIIIPCVYLVWNKIKNAKN